MKIVQINAVYEYSSTGRTTMEMHQSLRARGIESYVFCTNHHIPEEQVFMIGNKVDHKLHALGSRVFGRQAYFSYFATKSMIAHLRKINPDVVILRNLHGNYVNLPLLLKFLAKEDIATIVVLHDCWFFTGHCCHYTADKCYKWKEECHHCPILNEYNKSLFFDNTRSIFHMKKKLFNRIPRLAVVGVSDWITNEAKKSPIFANAKNILRIYNWIDLNKFYTRNVSALRESLGLLPTDFVALGVAQGWSNQKGLDIIVDVAKRMPHIKIVLVGQPPKDMPTNVIPVGKLSSVDKLAEYYSLANVFFNFSIQESFGKAAAESLCCGTPLIVNKATANPELCGNDCGFVIENKSIEKIINAIKTISSEGKETYATRCRDFAHVNFDRETNIDNYVKLFNSLQK